MTVLLDMKYGYVECDIDGSGYNSCAVWRNEDATDQTRPFRYLRTSLCYGKIDRSDLTKEELLQLLAEDHFMVSNRRSRKTYRDFVTELKRGAWDKPVNPIKGVLDEELEAVLLDELVVIPDPTSDDPGSEYDQFDEDGLCHCSGCEEARAGVSNVSVAQVTAPPIWQLDPLPNWLNRRMSR